MKNAISQMIVSLLVLASVSLFPACDKPVTVSDEVQATYGSQARSFCEKIVPCELDEMRKVLADDIQRRSYLEGRMTVEMCIQERLSQIQSRPASVPMFALCTEALKDLDCPAQLVQLRVDQNCKQALNL